MAETFEFQTEIEIVAGPELVYPSCSDARLLARWPGVAAKTHPRPGGTFELNVDGEPIARGKDLGPDSWRKTRDAG